MHNTLEGSYAGSLLANSGGIEGRAAHMPDYHIVNNIFDGLHSWTGDHIKTRSHNAYTSFAWDQDESDLNASELDLRETPLSDIFVAPDSANADLGLCDESPAILAGADIIPLLDSLGIRATFPDYDFTRDIKGAVRANPPSLGCIDYGSSLVITQPVDEWGEIDINEDVFPEADAIVGSGGINVYNNILKPSENKGVIITCNLSESADLSVILYDSRGKKIKTFYKGYVNQDTFSTIWYGKDDKGSVVGSGIYIVQMKIGGYSRTKKIAVIK